MKVLVTGGAGFIGSHLTERLLSLDYEVVVVDDFNNYYCPSWKRNNATKFFAHENCEIVECDIRNYSGMADIFDEHKFDFVYHLAARAGVRASIEDPFTYQEVNINGTLLLLEFIKKHPCKQFFFASTSSVYGDTEILPFKETNPLGKPLSPYAATKASAEMMIELYSKLYNINSTVFRFFTVYGDRGRPDMAVAIFTKAIMEGKTLKVFGDGSQKRDFTFISDIIDGIIAPLELNLTGHNLFNIGGGKTYELNDLINIIEDIVGKKAEVEYLDKAVGDMTGTFADTTRAGEVLGFESKVSLEEGIKIYYDWFDTNYEVLGDCVIC